MRALVCLVVLLTGCLPSAFDAADRAERAREAESKARQQHNASTSADSGAQPDAAPASQTQTPEPTPNPSSEAGGTAAAPAAGHSGEDSDAGAPPRAGNGATGTSGTAGAGNSAAVAGTGDTGAAGSPPPSCSDTASDPVNCGACGRDCSASSALVSCAAGSCMRACVATHADCNGDLGFGSEGDGCETPVTDDQKNCGGCNLRCDRVWGVVSSCVARKCLAIAPSVGTPSPVTPDPHGPGTGGMPFEQQCGRNAVLIGIDAAADADVLYGFASVCAPLWLSGAPEQLLLGPGDAQTFPMLGNNIDPAASTQRLTCPSGAVVTAVSGTFWRYAADTTLLTLKQLVLQCAQLDVDAQRQVVFGPSGIVTAGSEPMAIESFEDTCPPGQAVAGLGGRAGSLIDQLQTYCASISVTELPTGSSVQTQD